MLGCPRCSCRGAWSPAGHVPRTCRERARRAPTRTETLQIVTGSGTLCALTVACAKSTPKIAAQHPGESGAPTRRRSTVETFSCAARRSRHRKRQQRESYRALISMMNPSIRSKAGGVPPGFLAYAARQCFHSLRRYAIRASRSSGLGIRSKWIPSVDATGGAAPGGAFAWMNLNNSI